MIYVHGTEGGFVLGGESYKLSDQKVSDAFAKVSTTADHIRFEGCHVGEESLEMAAFGRLLTATYVSGFTVIGSVGVDAHGSRGVDQTTTQPHFFRPYRGTSWALRVCKRGTRPREHCLLCSR